LRPTRHSIGGSDLDDQQHHARSVQLGQHNISISSALAESTHSSSNDPPPDLDQQQHQLLDQISTAQ
jgi:hypothetical protein